MQRNVLLLDTCARKKRDDLRYRQQLNESGQGKRNKRNKPVGPGSDLDMDNLDDADNDDDDDNVDACVRITDCTRALARLRVVERDKS